LFLETDLSSLLIHLSSFHSTAHAKLDHRFVFHSFCTPHTSLFPVLSSHHFHQALHLSQNIFLAHSHNQAAKAPHASAIPHFQAIDIHDHITFLAISDHTA
jgi:hypothetical protein